MRSRSWAIVRSVIRNCLLAIPLYAGGPRDDFLLEQGVIRIQDEYRNKGFYLAEIEVDESRLKDSGIPDHQNRRKAPESASRRSNSSVTERFPPRNCHSKSPRSPTSLLFRKGQLEPEKLLDDVASLDRFYKDNGFVDVSRGHENPLLSTGQHGSQGRLRDRGRTSIPSSGRDRPLQHRRW